MNKKNIIIGLIAIILIIVGIALNNSYKPKTTISTNTDSKTNENLTTNVSFSCDSNKTIKASFYKGPTPAVALPDQPPVPTGSVKLSLSDGRSLELPQTISADGGRYASINNSIVFWNKGNSAFIIENNKDTYTGCIKVVNEAGNLSNVYENSKQGISIRYPEGFTVDKNYEY